MSDHEIVEKTVPARHFVRNFGWLFGGSIFAQGLLFVSNIYLARILGDASFGKWSLVQAWLLGGMVITEFGLPTYGMREVAKAPADATRIAAEIGTLRVLLALATFGAGSLLVWVVVEPSDLRLLFVASLVWLVASAFNTEWIFRGLEQTQYVAGGNFLQHASFLLFLLLWVRGPVDLLAVPVYRVLGTLLGSAVLLWILISRSGGAANLLWTSARPNLALWKAAAPMGVAAVLAQAYSVFGTIALGALQPPQVVGWYSAAYKLVTAVIVLNTLVTLSFLPKLSELFSVDDRLDSFDRVFRMFKRVIVSLSLLLLASVPFGRPIILHVYGDAYAASIPAFQILLVYVTVWLYTSLYGNALVAMRREKAVLPALAVGTAVGALLSPVLVLVLRSEGAAAALLISEACVCVLTAGAYRRARKDGLQCRY